MLKNYFLLQLGRVRKRQVVFQQDGAPAHYGRQGRQFLDNEFPGRWLGSYYYGLEFIIQAFI